VLRLGTFQGTSLPDFSVRSILNGAGSDPSLVSLGSFTALESLALDELVRIVPGLASLNVGQVPPLQELTGQYLDLSSSGALTIGELIQIPEVAGLTLAQLPTLESFAIDSIPGLADIPLSSIPNWQALPLSSVPGLELLPLSSFIQLPTSVPTAILDVVFSEAEQYRVRSISGSYQEGFDVPCEQANCAHVELGQPRPGQQWIAGFSQWVRGGTGCLVGMEPTGRHPFGAAFKVVITETDEAGGLAVFSSYFRYCVPCGCSPYIIGPFPLYQAAEKDTIIVGF
jgi:hypothetical protein